MNDGEKAYILAPEGLTDGMKVMSEGLQKLTGDRLRNILGAMTTNRFTGLLTGAFVTAAVQSSTATTVMTVSFRKRRSFLP